MPQKGFGTKVSFGVETTAGTEVARTVSVRPKSTSLSAKRNSDRVPHLVASSGSTNASEMFTTGIEVGGEVVMIGAYQGNGLGLLLEAVMGTVATTGAGPYVHAYTLGTSGLSLSACVERGVGGQGDEEFYGLHPVSMELSLATGALMEVKAEFIGMGVGARGADTPPGMGTPYYISHADCGTVSFDSSTYKASSVTLNVDTKIARLPELGSLYTSPPEREDFQEITLNVEFVSRSDALYTAHLADTRGDVSVTMTDGTRTLAITLHNACMTSYEDPISDAGVIRQQVTFRALGNDTNDGLAISLTNGNASNRTA